MPRAPHLLLPLSRFRKGQHKHLSFGSFVARKSFHFADVILKQRAGIDMIHVSFNGTPPVVQNSVITPNGRTEIRMKSSAGHVAAATSPTTRTRTRTELPGR